MRRLRSVAQRFQEQGNPPLFCGPLQVAAVTLRQEEGFFVVYA